MASLSFTLNTTCTGGGHVGVDLSVNGSGALHYHYNTDELRASLASMSAEDQASAALAVLKLHFAGKTRAQIATEFQSPVVIAI